MAELLEKLNYRQYQFQVAGTLRALFNEPGGGIPEGCNCAQGTITLGGCFNLSFDAALLPEHYGTEQIASNPLTYRTKGAVCFYIEYNLDGTNYRLIWVTPESEAIVTEYTVPGEGQLEVLSYVCPDQSCQIEVSVSGMTDLYSQAISEAADPGRWASGRRNASADLCYDVSVTSREVIKDPTITIKLGDISGNDYQQVTFTRTGYQTDAKHIQVSAYGIGIQTAAYIDTGGNLVLGRPEDYSLAAEGKTGNVVELSYWRTGGVCSEPGIYDWYDDQPRTLYVYGTPYYQAHCRVGGGTLSCGGGPVGGVQGIYPLTDSRSNHVTSSVEFTDITGAESISFGMPVDMDGATRFDVLSITGLERHVSKTNPDPDPVNIMQHQSINYKGAWSVTTYAIDGYGSDRFVDLPQDIGINGYISHGELQVDDLISTLNYQAQTWSEAAIGEPQHPPWFPLPSLTYDTSGNVTGVATGPDYPDGVAWHDSQCLVSSSDWSIEGALRVSVAPEGDGAVPFRFGDFTTWAATDCTTTQVSGEAGYLEVVAASASAQVDLTDELFEANIRLTGTRFAKVHWYTDTPEAQAALSIGGHTWNLTAGITPGEQTTLIDLCKPDSSTVEPAGNLTQTGVIENLPTPIETDHPLVADREYWLELTYPEGAYDLEFFMEIDEAPYGVEVCDSNGTFMDLLWCTGIGNTWTTGPYNPGPGAEPNVLKIHIPAEASDPLFQGLKITRLRYKGVALGDGSVQQSLAEYELPFDTSYDGGGGYGVRQPEDSYYKWEFPAGFGVGRMVSCKLQCKNAGATYRFGSIQLYRKTAEEGGWARVIVFPHQSCWNDTRDCRDFAWSYAGERMTPWSVDWAFAIRKWVLLVDGAIVLEGLAGREDEIFYDPRDFSFPCHWMTQYRLGETGWPGGVVAFPVDDYAAPTVHATNGMASAQVLNTPGNEFLTSLYTAPYLNAGVYNIGSSGYVDIDWTFWADSTSRHAAEGNRTGGLLKVFRARVHGIAPPGAEITVTTLDPSTGHFKAETVYADEVGYFQTSAFNTHGPLDTTASASETDHHLLSMASSGHLIRHPENHHLVYLQINDRTVEIPVRNRMWIWVSLL